MGQLMAVPLAGATKCSRRLGAAVRRIRPALGMGLAVRNEPLRTRSPPESAFAPDDRGPVAGALSPVWPRT